MNKQDIINTLRVAIDSGATRFKLKKGGLAYKETALSRLESLNKEQLLGAMALLLKGDKTTIVSGDPGTGKSYMCRVVIEEMQQLFDVHIVCLAQLGIAASAWAGGRTIASALHIGIKTPYPPLDGMLSDKEHSIKRSYKKIEQDVLGQRGDMLVLVDEVSQVPGQVMTCLLLALEWLERQGFGERHLLLIGDPKQMKPITGSAVWEDSTWALNIGVEVSYAGALNLDGLDPLKIKEKSPVVNYNPTYIYLTEVVRSKDCMALTKAMKELGHGEIFGGGHTEALKDRVYRSLGMFKDESNSLPAGLLNNYKQGATSVEELYYRLKEEGIENVVVLVPFNKHLRAWADFIAQGVTTKRMTYSTYINYRGYKGWVVEADDDLYNVVIEDDKGKRRTMTKEMASYIFGGTRVPPLMSTYVGATMLVSGNNRDKGVFNGTTCKVAEVNKDSVTIKVKGKLIKLDYETKEIGEDGEGYIKQIQLSPGDAITIDRTQGLTFSKEDTAVIVYLPCSKADKNAMEYFFKEKYAGIYQAFSRVEDISQLYIVSNYEMIKSCTVADSNAIQVADQMKAKAVEAGWLSEAASKVGLVESDIQVISRQEYSNKQSLPYQEQHGLSFDGDALVYHVVTNNETDYLCLYCIEKDEVVGIRKIVMVNANKPKVEIVFSAEWGSSPVNQDVLLVSKIKGLLEPKKEIVVKSPSKTIWRTKSQVFWGQRGDRKNYLNILYPPVVEYYKGEFIMKLPDGNVLTSSSDQVLDTWDKGYVLWFGEGVTVLEITDWMLFTKMEYRKAEEILAISNVVTINELGDRKEVHQASIPKEPTEVIAVVADKGFSDSELLARSLDSIRLTIKGEVRLLNLGEEYAAQHGLLYEPYEEDNFLAFNKGIVNSSTYILCFWDGKTSETKNLIELAKANQVPITVVNY